VSEDSDTPAADTSGARPSWPDWLGDAASLAQEGLGLAAQIQADWEHLSLRETPWTTDTIMNEVVNSWERLTPFLGNMIQHGVEGASQFLRELWPEVSADIATWRSVLEDSPIGAVTSKYAGLSQSMADRMLRGDYQSADAVETLAQFGGMWAKDLWRRSAQARGSATADTAKEEHVSPPDDASPPDVSPPDADAS
jgi:hypothetical protein